MKKLRMFAFWYSSVNNWVRFPVDTIIVALLLFMFAAPIFYFDPQHALSRPVLGALGFGTCFSPVGGIVILSFRGGLF
jgi:hypothetical protein